MNKLSVIIVFLIVNALAVFSQQNEEIFISSVQGVGYDESVSIAKEKAINDAKIKALAKAGIEENINAFTDLYKSEISDNYSELFTSQVFTNIRGSVKNIEILNEEKSFSGNQIKYSVEIKCTVIKYNSLADVFYKAEIKGIKPFYYEEDYLSWTLSVSKNSWLYVFCIPQNQDDAYFIFPNDYEQQFLIKADSIYNFPIEVTLPQFLDGDKQQTDRLIFVLTKEKYPYKGKITYKNIIDWIFEISPDQRIVESFSVSILPKE
ncbi:MAG TPA: hypothetical protein PKN32_02630 [Bacteroidales bacterium]|nr:hypothetical protein [Bacteroidales bacterium]